MLSKLDHPYIVKAKEAYRSSEQLWLVTEFCKGKDLLDQVFNSNTLSES